MKIQRISKSDRMCDDCLEQYPGTPLEATTIIDHRYLCNVHADEEINQDLYDEIDHQYDRSYEDD